MYIQAERLGRYMNQNKIVLHCKRVKFFSAHDEDAFFEWLKKIPAIIDIVGERDSINLYVAAKSLDDEDLRSIVTLFRRYKVTLREVKQLVTDENREVFEYCKYGTSINVYPAK